jgi:hypothetical protein
MCALRNSLVRSNHSGKARRKETTRKTIRREENYIKIGLRETGWGGMD